MSDGMKVGNIPQELIDAMHKSLSDLPSHDEVTSLCEQLEASNQRELELLAAFHRNMTIAYPSKSHDEISNEIAKVSSQALREHEAKVLEEAAELANKHSTEMENTGGRNAEDSPGRDRCYVRARTAKYISDELRRMAEERRKK